MSRRSVHRSPLPRLSMRYTATVETHDGWWFRYVVRRLHGPFIPEKSNSYHRTRRRAERAARKWTARNDRPAPTIVSSFGERP